MSLNNEDIKQLIAILQKGLSNENDSDQTEVKQEQTQPKRKTKQTNSKKKASSKQSPKSYNKFDSMPEHNMHREDSKVDQLLIKYPPTQRSREFEHINVVCRVCGKKESVSPTLVYEAPNRYKCNKCSRVPG